jgi:hypothetical protein
MSGPQRNRIIFLQQNRDKIEENRIEKEMIPLPSLEIEVVPKTIDQDEYYKPMIVESNEVKSQKKTVFSMLNYSFIKTTKEFKHVFFKSAFTNSIALFLTAQNSMQQPLNRNFRAADSKFYVKLLPLTTKKIQIFYLISFYASILSLKKKRKLTAFSVLYNSLFSQNKPIMKVKLRK